ncbi:hypothetical protein ARMSODRAFT_975842 [Armillaria solidipes]|uniref:Uncharacterized protein n=1 Tax=Armillaria solidipes TaxID=1076256 RepID=A0A2H3BC49_9AGAR|nr:hypothetical protein ARMSODRAFT_975842 [Armillaria solidipes]
MHGDTRTILHVNLYPAQHFTGWGHSIRARLPSEGVLRWWYCVSVEHGKDIVEERPLFLTFKEIGERFGEFNLAADEYPDDVGDHGAKEECKKIDLVDKDFVLDNVTKTKSLFLPTPRRESQEDELSTLLSFIRISTSHKYTMAGTKARSANHL